MRKKVEMAEKNRNHEHYCDRTASDAIRNMEFEEKRQKDFEDFLNVIWDVARLSGFNIQGRIIVKDLQTGIVHK